MKRYFPPRSSGYTLSNLEKIAVDFTRVLGTIIEAGYENKKHDA
jgi:hypothetical protein